MKAEKQERRWPLSLTYHQDDVILKSTWYHTHFNHPTLGWGWGWGWGALAHSLHHTLLSLLTLDFHCTHRLFPAVASLSLSIHAHAHTHTHNPAVIPMKRRSLLKPPDLLAAFCSNSPVCGRTSWALNKHCHMCEGVSAWPQQGRGRWSAPVAAAAARHYPPWGTESPGSGAC